MDTKIKQNEQNEHNILECIGCNYKCSKKSNYIRHISTDKHKRIHLGYISEVKTSKNEHNNNYGNNYFICECGHKYKYSQGLSKHKKQCINNSSYDKNNNKSINNTNNTINEFTDKQLILTLIKENSELKNMMMEVIKNGTNNVTHTNSHNKTFNLQVFLNETCKDAMNIMDFVDSIKLQLSDFERVGEVGFVNGISDIIIKNLKQLDITERPIHCTDKKREIMYVKDDNKWEKEDNTNKKIRSAIKYIANKNINLMDAYKALHPDCQKSHSIYSDSYNKFVIEALGGSGNEDCDNEDKIITRLSKVVTIEK